MAETIDIHQPVLVNTLGHSAGIIIFAIFLYLFLRDRKRAKVRGSLLPAAAALLAFLWNAGSVLVLGSSSESYSLRLIVAFSYSFLSLLPAVLLQLSLKGRYPMLWRSGYAISGAALLLHMAELFNSSNAALHQLGVYVISVGFSALTTLAIVWLTRKGNRSETPRLVGAMASFLMAISFVHFGTAAHESRAFSGELAIHHAGIPLSLLVLLQEYRFLLLDVFVRLLANATLAAVFIVAALTLNDRFHVLQRTADPFFEALLIVTVCLALLAFSYSRSLVQKAVTRLVLRRSGFGKVVEELIAAGSTATFEADFLASSANTVAKFFHSEQHQLTAAVTAIPELFHPEPISDPTRLPITRNAEWAEVAAPLPFSRGDIAYLLLGRRQGGRRYLSEDLDALRRLAAVVVDQVERLRAAEMRQLISQAELRALQAQINPHFLFNSLNALYGIIPRNAEGARQTVLNLSQIFRYFLQTDKTYISLEEELEIVRAYLDIEKLRLGHRLHTEIDVESDVLLTQIPALSLQPLVENAVKHGVATKPGLGWVRVQAYSTEGGVRIAVSDSGGAFDPSLLGGDGNRIGMDNVQHRLKLCYGPNAELSVVFADGATVVSFIAMQGTTSLAMKSR